MGIAGRTFAAVFAFGLAAGCSTETELLITAEGQNAEEQVVSLSNVTLDILPYDIDSLYASLEAETQPGSPPVADSIRVLSSTYQDVCTSYRVTGDSIEAVQARATAITDRTSEEYNRVFDEYQALVAREEARFTQCQEVTDTYTAIRNDYRAERQAWEERAWPAERFAAAESVRVGTKTIQQVETEPDGTASVTVPNGTWWVLGTAPVPGSISQQYRWNVAVTATGGVDTVRLTGENAVLEPVF